MTEAEVEKQNTSHKKYDLCAEKQAKLLKAIAEERKSAVGPEALNLSVQALAASAEAAVLDKHKKKRFLFEKEGAVFKFKVPLEAPQAHFKYYLENKETCLGLIDGKVEASMARRRQRRCSGKQRWQPPSPSWRQRLSS